MTDKHGRIYPFRYPIFTAGWAGVGISQVIYLTGLISLLQRRIQKYNPHEYISEDIHLIARRYAGSQPESFSYLIIIGRLLMFVSGVMTLFTYSGNQLYKWVVLAIGMILLNISVFPFGGVATSAKSYMLEVEIVIVAVGIILASVGVVIIQLGDNTTKTPVTQGKAIIILGIFCGGASFPIGYMMVYLMGEMYITIVMILISLVLTTIGISYIAYTLHYASVEISDGIHKDEAQPLINSLSA